MNRRLWLERVEGLTPSARVRYYRRYKRRLAPNLRRNRYTSRYHWNEQPPLYASRILDRALDNILWRDTFGTRKPSSILTAPSTTVRRSYHRLLENSRLQTVEPD